MIMPCNTTTAGRTWVRHKMVSCPTEAYPVHALGCGRAGRLGQLQRELQRRQFGGGVS